VLIEEVPLFKFVQRLDTLHAAAKVARASEQDKEGLQGSFKRGVHSWPIIAREAHRPAQVLCWEAGVYLTEILAPCLRPPAFCKACHLCLH
jgi:hypothetical protein